MKLAKFSDKKLHAVVNAFGAMLQRENDEWKAAHVVGSKEHAAMQRKLAFIAEQEEQRKKVAEVLRQQRAA